MRVRIREELGMKEKSWKMEERKPRGTGTGKGMEKEQGSE